MSQWEYRAYPISFEIIEDAIQALQGAGKEGWELVAALPQAVPDRPSTVLLIYKRPKH